MRDILCQKCTKEIASHVMVMAETPNSPILIYICSECNNLSYAGMGEPLGRIGGKNDYEHRDKM